MKMKLKRAFSGLLMCFFFVCPALGEARHTEKKTVAFESLAGHIKCDIFQPNFLWGDSSYTALIYASDGKIYFSIGSHNTDHACRFFSFDPTTEKVTLIGEMDKVLGEDAEKQISQGKIHTRMFEHKGKIWFATHTGFYQRGVSGINYRGKAPYKGGHFMNYDLATGQFNDLARIFPNEGIISMTMDKVNEVLYGLTWPSGILVSYDIKTDDLRYWGAVQHRGEWGHRGGTEWDMICRTPTVDPNGCVYGSTVNGQIWKYDPTKVRRVSYIEGLDLSYVPFSQSAEEILKGDFRNNWRTIEWNPKTNSFWGLHFQCTTLFEFDPVANYIRTVDELRPTAYRGMPANPEISQLGFTIGPKNTIFYLAHGPMVKIEGRQRLRCNLYLITYDIDTQKYTDHGPIFSNDGRRVFFAESIAIAADDHIYSVAWVEVADKERAKTLRMARTKGAPEETQRAVYEILLVRLPKWQEFVK
jgi:hypothetical protein